MSTAKMGLLALVVLALVIGACGPDTLPETGGTATTSPLQPGPLPGSTSEPGSTQVPTSEPEPTAPASGMTDVVTLDDLIAALEEQGATVTKGDQFEQDFFPVGAQILSVDGEDVQVFEFEDEASAQAAAGTVQANGYIIGLAAVDWITQPSFWTTGQLIVLYVGTDISVIDRLSAILGEPFISEQTWSDERPGAVELAVTELSVMAGAAASDIEVVSFEPVDWPDACLGLPEQGEACATVITPGWKIVLEVDDQQYEFHTDETGENIRFLEL